VLDPLCGAGTIIIERGLMAAYDRLIGGDLREEAVTMARRNARTADVTATWRAWDARSLPLDDASVTRVITNLPFGKQLGSHEENATLYAVLADEFKRVLSADGLLVALTSEDRLWEATLQERGWRLSKKVVIVVLGQPASIFVAEHV
jgi:23S rRNA G2445 N2-methylase RlmL